MFFFLTQNFQIIPLDPAPRKIMSVSFDRGSWVEHMTQLKGGLNSYYRNPDKFCQVFMPKAKDWNGTDIFLPTNLP